MAFRSSHQEITRGCIMLGASISEWQEDKRIRRYLWGACSSCWREWWLGRAEGCWMGWAPGCCSSQFETGAHWPAGSPEPCGPPPEGGLPPSRFAQSPTTHEEVEDCCFFSLWITINQSLKVYSYSKEGREMFVTSLHMSSLHSMWI